MKEIAHQMRRVFGPVSDVQKTDFLLAALADPDDDADPELTSQEAFASYRRAAKKSQLVESR